MRISLEHLFSVMCVPMPVSNLTRTGKHQNRTRIPSGRVTPSVTSVSSPRVTPSVNPVLSPRVTTSGNPMLSPRVTPSVKSVLSPRVTPSGNPVLSPRVTLSGNPVLSPMKRLRCTCGIAPSVNCHLESAEQFGSAQVEPA